MYFKHITFKNVTGRTPNHLLLYQHTPDLHPGTAKAIGGMGASVYFVRKPILNTSFYIYNYYTELSPPCQNCSVAPVWINLNCIRNVCVG